METMKPNFKFIGREGNQCVDAIAKKASLCPLYYALLDNCTPLWLTLMVDRETAMLFF